MGEAEDKERHTSSSHRRHRERKHSHEKKRKHKRDKHSEHRRHRRRSRSPEEKSHTDTKRLLEQGRIAMRSLRELLGYQYSLKDEMKELIRQLDAGKRLDVSAIPDAYVLEKVCLVFDNINLIRRSRDGTYTRRYPDVSVMSLLEPVLEEKREDLERMYQESVGMMEHVEEERHEQRRPAGPLMPSLEERWQAEARMNQNEYDEQEPEAGPSLPEFAGEDLEESSDARLQAVGRIVKVLENHKAKRLLGKDKAAIPPNPYEILNVDRTASSSEIKKKFLRLSLLIHPDKCDHPSAPTAFDAVSTAAKRLQDPDERLLADREVEAMEHMEITKAMEKEKERELAWKVARGEVVQEDLMPLRREREAWMTTVPSSGPLSHMKSQTQFKSRAAPAHDESWTRTPGHHGVGPQPRVAGPAPKSTHEEKVVETRPKSLLEKHTEALNASKELDSHSVGKGGVKYRPFNRETDLDIKKPVDPKDFMSNLKNLNGRFGKGSM